MARTEELQSRFRKRPADSSKRGALRNLIDAWANGQRVWYKGKLWKVTIGDRPHLEDPPEANLKVQLTDPIAV